MLEEGRLMPPLIILQLVEDSQSGFLHLYLLVLSELHLAHFTQSFAPSCVIFLKCLAFGPLFISRSIHSMKPTNLC